METIHVKFDELTAMASECNNSGPDLNCSNFQDSSEELNEIPSQQDLDNLFGPLYKEYYAPSTSKVSNNSAANTLDDDDTPSPSSIIVEDKDVVELNGNTVMYFFEIPEFEEAESSSNYQDPSNMHEFHQQHCYTDKWTKNHPIEQVIGNPSKLVQTRNRLRSDLELYMYVLTASLTEPKNIKEAMLDHSWIKSMQDELNQFKGLDVCELVPLHESRHAIKMDVKTAFLNGPLKEEVFVGIVDPTLYTRRYRDGILLVQIYVDDISFGSTNPVFSNRFEKLMKDNFEMSMMGEMKFFLGLQIHQSPRGIFINQSQYTMELLRKHGMEKCDIVTIPMATAKIDADLQ
ncbi:retrovirus-related pol polyprotein from transposon TNT 1-94, partial [Tanacetum coccineum]